MGIVEAASQKIADVDKAISPFRQAAEKVKAVADNMPKAAGPDKAKEKQVSNYATRLAGEQASIGAAMGPTVRVSDAIKTVK
jgi:hypothetical protein